MPSSAGSSVSPAPSGGGGPAAAAAAAAATAAAAAALSGPSPAQLLLQQQQEQQRQQRQQMQQQQGLSKGGGGEGGGSSGSSSSSGGGDACGGVGGAADDEMSGGEASVEAVGVMRNAVSHILRNLQEVCIPGLLCSCTLESDSFNYLATRLDEWTRAVHAHRQLCGSVLSNPEKALEVEKKRRKDTSNGNEGNSSVKVKQEEERNSDGEGKKRGTADAPHEEEGQSSCSATGDPATDPQAATMVLAPYLKLFAQCIRKNRLPNEMEAEVQVLLLDALVHLGALSGFKGTGTGGVVMVPSNQQTSPPTGALPPGQAAPAVAHSGPPPFQQMTSVSGDSLDNTARQQRCGNVGQASLSVTLPPRVKTEEVYGLKDEKTLVETEGGGGMTVMRGIDEGESSSSGGNFACLSVTTPVGTDGSVPVSFRQPQQPERGEAGGRGREDEHARGQVQMAADHRTSAFQGSFAAESGGRGSVKETERAGESVVALPQLQREGERNNNDSEVVGTADKGRNDAAARIQGEANSVSGHSSSAAQLEHGEVGGGGMICCPVNCGTAAPATPFVLTSSSVGTEEGRGLVTTAGTDPLRSAGRKRGAGEDDGGTTGEEERERKRSSSSSSTTSAAAGVPAATLPAVLVDRMSPLGLVSLREGEGAEKADQEAVGMSATPLPNEQRQVDLYEKTGRGGGGEEGRNEMTGLPSCTYPSAVMMFRSNDDHLRTKERERGGENTAGGDPLTLSRTNKTGNDKGRADNMQVVYIEG